MHPQFAYDIARLRHDELTSAAYRAGAPTASRRTPFWRRRRRGATTGVETRARQLVGLPPPRPARDPAGPDRRVA